MQDAHRRAGRVTVGAAVLVAGALIALAGGCAPRAETPAPAPEPASVKPAWGVAALKRALPAVVFVRGRELCVQRLDSATPTPIWTAPAETSPTILAVDQPSGRIAVLLRAGAALDGEVPWRDAGIVVLAGDGSARMLPVQPVLRHGILRPGGGHRIDTDPASAERQPREASAEAIDAAAEARDAAAVVPDLVTSGAFLGRDLALATQHGSYYHYGPVPGTPLLLSAEGSTTTLSDEASRSAGVASQFWQLANGRVLAQHGGPYGTTRASGQSLVELHDGVLTRVSPTFSFMHQTLPSLETTDTSPLFAYHLEIPDSNRLVMLSLVSGAWRAAAIPIDKAFGFNQVHNEGAHRIDVGRPEPGPPGVVLARVAFVDKPNLANEFRLFAFNAMTGAVSATAVDVEDPVLGGSTWTYVARFGQ